MKKDKYDQLLDLAISIETSARRSGMCISSGEAMKKARGRMGIPEPADVVKPPGKSAT